MAKLGYTVNPDETIDSYDVIPAGEYTAIIESSDYVDNKKGTGKILKLTYQIIDGPMKDRKIFDNLSLENPSAQAVEIAKKVLNSIGVATGVGHVDDSYDLHDIPMKIKVKIEGKEEDDYGRKNRITKYTAINAQAAVNPNIPKTSEPADTNATPVASATPPWQK